MLRQAVEQGNAHGQAELLTTDAVDQRLKDRREARRLGPPEAVYQSVQLRILRREIIKRRQIDVEAQHPLQNHCHR
jgi:hypothetical protein